MGDFADDLEDLAIRQLAEFDLEVNYLMSEATCEKLVSLAAKSREGIIIGIRNYWTDKKVLSHKQKMVLAKWIVNHS